MCVSIYRHHLHVQWLEFQNRGIIRAGQAVVQMAKSRHNRLEYAIKFYLSQAAFEAEVELYGTRGGAPASPLAQFLPLVRSDL